MKKFLMIVLSLVLIMGLAVGCTSTADNGEKDSVVDNGDEIVADGFYDDGRYRGIYEDRGEQQVSIQFHLEDGVLTDLSYRHLYHSGVDYREIGDDHALYPVLEQHDQVLEYLEGKPLEAIADLYSTEDFVDDIDVYTGATIRGSKIVSAIQDGLNRGLYTPDGEFSREITEYDDGRYRGIYGDRGEQQVSIQFHLEDNVLTDLSYRHLYHSGIDYRDMDEDDSLYAIVEQHEQLLEYLEGKPLETIFDLHSPGDFVEDVDVYTGATIRANKVFSAMMDGLNRGLYSPDNEFSTELPDYEDGRYRGIFGDRGEQQVSIQFHLEDNVLTDISYRHLYHSGIDYRDIDEDHTLYPVAEQHQQIIEYLEGKSLESVFDLHSPGEFIEDIDGYTGASIRGNKVFSAIIDGLNRGIY
ncbi:hypothetical protein PRVXH_000798 [Proteinivorax hydrogeniformans]|uniref:FMN-binding protein n=1 Tax=Proteinivorax hydrogeniformans TaxID=1826727 RepID=A0AAU8HVN7_9FIRM